MDDQITFDSIIKKSILNSDLFTSVSIIDIFLGTFTAFFIGLFIYYVYKKTFQGVVYSHNFNITLVLMTMITSLVIMTISTNIVLSLGMVGALSIVRFRTAIKDPLDIVFMFWSISVGIAVGAGIYPVAIFGSLFIALAVYILSKKKWKDITYLLIIHYEEKAEQEIKNQLVKFNYDLKSKIIRNNWIELTLKVKLKVDNTAFVHKLSEIEGVKDVSLVQYNGDYAA
ncbi:DUF4956 domain-containing protein [Metabacillus fastidiosus]|uniref:DUF4956 domain-containing protein n=1 Tax=Metabacillus fastidiosus TaxID=1458 RepID=A0ABU6P2Y9_9BACI|nr:DUF4956 domain-containing protein [Metabacillus fastidiosus]MED4403393.1 DUF4956 domain-containing protein [Metabacillus fastidiosus]MED4453989.1 DUF4956 domain-containing protein [Metabacillus fastidiosus]MED4460747.1 DUF4956 domain-containing protein [Metabacillus fastidiosus]